MSLPQSAPADRPALGNYEIHTAREGFASILHVPSGEIMHSRMHPMEEAHCLYIGQSRLGERLRAVRQIAAVDAASPLVIWDVGLGAAANAMAAIQCHEAAALAGAVRPLQIISFENDLDSLRLALAHIDRFPYLRHDAPAALLRRGRWQSRDHSASWQLIAGDFLETVQNAPAAPELIFYDMYSAKTHPGQWTPALFRSVFAACAGNNAGQGTELFTYTVSTAARAAFLAAGFYVARGRAAGGKQETTIAFTPAALSGQFAPRHQLLGEAWLAKWKRSRARIPSWVPAGGETAFEQSIRDHPQFRSINSGLDPEISKPARP